MISVGLLFSVGDLSPIPLSVFPLSYFEFTLASGFGSFSSMSPLFVFCSLSFSFSVGFFWLFSFGFWAYQSSRRDFDDIFDNFRPFPVIF